MHFPYCEYFCVDFSLTDLEIVGFIDIADISSPPVLSRHLVLPIALNKGEFSSSPFGLHGALCFLKSFLSAGW